MVINLDTLLKSLAIELVKKVLTGHIDIDTSMEITEKNIPLTSKNIKNGLVYDGSEYNKEDLGSFEIVTLNEDRDYDEVFSGYLNGIFKYFNVSVVRYGNGGEMLLSIDLENEDSGGLDIILEELGDDMDIQNEVFSSYLNGIFKYFNILVLQYGNRGEMILSIDLGDEGSGVLHITLEELGGQIDLKKFWERIDYLKNKLELNK